MAADCRRQVDQILRSTIRIELEYWSEGRPVAEDDAPFLKTIEVTSHATLVGERYLVTHNHSPISPRELKEDDAGPQLRLSLYTLDGEAVLRGASLLKFDVVAEQPETLVLDFRETGAVLFQAFGLQSAPMATAADVRPEPGAEVAQINWDGETTFVDWTTIQRVAIDGVTRIILDNEVITGASGGGVFWNGIHIGNNWSANEVRDSGTGEIVRAFSVAAYNVDMVIAGTAPAPASPAAGPASGCEGLSPQLECLS